jgi:outer membrane protein OmpA-like peptidoglycan-associated protein
VIGHTDTVGSHDDNDVLSLKRASYVKGLLIKLGIAPEQISVAGRGERELLVPTEDGVDEQKNRRVEVNVR